MDAPVERALVCVRKGLEHFEVAMRADKWADALAPLVEARVEFEDCRDQLVYYVEDGGAADLTALASAAAESLRRERDLLGVAERLACELRGILDEYRLERS